MDRRFVDPSTAAEGGLGRGRDLTGAVSFLTFGTPGASLPADFDTESDRLRVSTHGDLEVSSTGALVGEGDSTASSESVSIVRDETHSAPTHTVSFILLLRGTNWKRGTALTELSVESAMSLM